MSDREHLLRDTTIGSTERQAELAEVFVALADTLVDDFDVVELLDRLANACVDLLDVKAAGILLVHRQGGVGVVASSSEDSQLLELFQVQNDEGPCLDCVRTGQPVTGSDLSVESDRWPMFAPVAVAAGFLAVDAFPLRLRSEAIGGLNIFHGTPTTFDATDRRIAQALADTATVGILQQRALHGSSVVAGQLQTALNSRITIEQAKGMLVEWTQLGFDEVFALLRKYARDHNLKLTDVARAITDRTLPLEHLLP
jgi:transcriptional regulator with GAF, ATPase, and Fis domain